MILHPVHKRYHLKLRRIDETISNLVSSMRQVSNRTTVVRVKITWHFQVRSFIKHTFFCACELSRLSLLHLTGNGSSTATGFTRAASAFRVDRSLPHLSCASGVVCVRSKGLPPNRLAGLSKDRLELHPESCVPSEVVTVFSTLVLTSSPTLSSHIFSCTTSSTPNSNVLLVCVSPTSHIPTFTATFST